MLLCNEGSKEKKNDRKNIEKYFTEENLKTYKILL